MNSHRPALIKTPPMTRTSPAHQHTLRWLLTSLVLITGGMLCAHANDDHDTPKPKIMAPNTLRDKFDETTWTLHGRLGFLDMIYTGSYLHHQAVQKADYARYSNIGLYVPYYECDRGVYYNAAYNGNIGNTCYSPSKSYQVRNRTLRTTHEFRVTTPAAERLRGTFGLFYDLNKLYDNTDWSYLEPLAGFINPRAPNPAVNPHDPSARPLVLD